jgi:thiamine-monophosphate kinase
MEHSNLKMSELGEKAYVGHLFERFKHTQSFAAQPDDAAIVELSAMFDRVTLKIDRGPSAVSYKFGLSDRTVDGRLAATACCSDLLAAWSHPRALMISATIPADTLVEDVDAALDGFLEICTQNGVEFVGGDTKAGPWNLVSCGLGEVRSVAAHRGSGEPGDVILVCGEVGSFTAATLRAMETTDAISLQQAVEILCYPKARWEEAAWLHEMVTPSSGTDASDGLYEALLNVAGSGCGVRVDYDNLPFSDLARSVSRKTGIPLINFLYGGGDWNLVFAIPRDDYVRIRECRIPEGLYIQPVGEVTSVKGFRLCTAEREERDLLGMVSDHFVGRIEDPHKYFERLRRYSG